MPLKELAATGRSPNLPSDVSNIKQEECEDFLTLSDDFQRLEVRDDSIYRFFGKSSSVQLIQTVMDVKHGYVSSADSWLPPSLFDAMRPEFRTRRSVSVHPIQQLRFEEFTDGLPSGSGTTQSRPTYAHTCSHQTIS